MSENGEVPSEIDMGYEEAMPGRRRGSMSLAQERERRASIQAILANDSLAPIEKRRSIQFLMDGRRNSMSAGSMTSSLQANYLDDDNTIVSYGYDKEWAKEYAFSNQQTRATEERRPPCNHYERNCTIISPCCGAAFGCRICHDECPALPPRISNASEYQRSASMPTSFSTVRESYEENDAEDHQIDRFAIREIICRSCYTRQSSKTNKCVECGIQFGAYHCSICNLWMNDAERPYHCEKCGFCRIGGAENFLHCDSCGMCIDKTLFDGHDCKDGKYKANCPVCQEYLFSSRSASHEMPCGHAIHWECFRELAAHDSRCPICKKTAETKERMMPTWNEMAAGVALQPVPPELARVVNITCNDCETCDDGRAWHYLGIQCHNCSSFNTVVNHILLSGEEAHEYIERKGTQQGSDEPRRQVTRRRSNRRSSIM